ncbi:hypothetical protein [Oceanobacillus kapialis]|uniref:DUF5067 domain-containing protein n=1 Tax=Oceanobacillus kapialis TaxID=481353 RepID=A0ABW5Q479_9BACI
MNRQKIMLLILLSLLGLITACTTEAKGQGASIKEGELTDYERSLTDMVSENFFVYDVEFLNDNATTINLKVDYYQEGEHIDTIIDLASSLEDIEKNSEVRLLFMSTPFQDQEKWDAAIITENGMASTTVDEGLPKIEEVGGISGYTGQTELKIGEETIIGSVVKSDRDTITSPVNMDTEEGLKKATSYEHVFILSATLKDCPIGDAGCAE